ncbi:hypothetical protein A2U01_0104979, partial [Trifolium medium]|nr:hypothetical protein [Trifolium medium]
MASDLAISAFLRVELEFVD